MNAKFLRRSAGFTLLEVMITIGILATMMLAVTSLLKNSFDIRFALSNKAKVSHRLNIAMRSISEDLSEAYIVSSKDTKRSNAERTTKTIFQITKEMGSDVLRFTTMNNRSPFKNQKESDEAFVVYKVKENKKISGRKDLYRGVMTKLPSSFREDPEVSILAKNIKSLSFEYWRGDKWVKDKWDSTSSDTRDKIPHMVKLEVEAWTEDLEEGDEVAEYHEETVKVSTIVYLPYSLAFPELKNKIKSLKL